MSRTTSAPPRPAGTARDPRSVSAEGVGPVVVQRLLRGYLACVQVIGCVVLGGLAYSGTSNGVVGFVAGVLAVVLVTVARVVTEGQR